MIGAVNGVSVHNKSFGAGVSASLGNIQQKENLEKAPLKDVFFESVSRGYVNGLVEGAIFNSKDREAKNGKFLLAQYGALTTGVVMIYGSLLRRAFKGGKSEHSSILSAFKLSNLKKGLGAKLGLVLLTASIAIGFVNKHDAKKTAKERGVDTVKNIVTSEKLQKLQEDAKTINQEIAKENNRLLNMQYNDNLAVFQKVAAGK